MAAQLDHTVAFQEFSLALRQEAMSMWTKAINEWEHDPSIPNPFELKEKRKYKEILVIYNLT